MQGNTKFLAERHLDCKWRWRPETGMGISLKHERAAAKPPFELDHADRSDCGRLPLLEFCQTVGQQGLELDERRGEAFNAFLELVGSHAVGGVHGVKRYLVNV